MSAAVDELRQLSPVTRACHCCRLARGQGRSRSSRGATAVDARGYPQSDVPTDPAAYSQCHAVSDAVAVLDAAAIKE